MSPTLTYIFFVLQAGDMVETFCVFLWHVSFKFLCFFCQPWKLSSRFVDLQSSRICQLLRPKTTNRPPEQTSPVTPPAMRWKIDFRTLNLRSHQVIGVARCHVPTMHGMWMFFFVVAYCQFLFLVKDAWNKAWWGLKLTFTFILDCPPSQ